MRPLRHLRPAKGAALVEGVAAIAMLVMITTGCILLLLNTGMSVYYKQKLAFVADQTAHFVAIQAVPMTISGGTSTVFDKGTEMAKALIQAMGMNPDLTDVSIQPLVVDNVPAFQVTLSSEMKLFGRGDILPMTVTISDTAVALKGTTPDTLVWLPKIPMVKPYLVPVVSIPPSGPYGLGLPVVVR